MGCTPSKQVDASKEGSNGSDYGMYTIIYVVLLPIVLHRIILYPIVLCRNIVRYPFVLCHVVVAFALIFSCSLSHCC